MTVVFVGVVESINHVKQSVTVSCFAVTSVKDGATKPALHARNTAATTASTASAKRNVVTLVILVTRIAPGSASITDVPNCVGSCAIAGDVTCHVQIYFVTCILVSVSVGN